MEYRINKVSSWNGWDPLKQVLLGNCFSPEWFRDVKDETLKKMIQTLVSDTMEDLDGIQRTLEDLGVDVIRVPENTIDNGMNLDDEGIDSWGKYNEYISDNDLDFARRSWKNGLPKPMITPRDYWITLGDKFVQTAHHAGLDSLIKRGLIDPDIVEGFTDEARVNQWRADGFPTRGPLKLSNEYKKQIAPNWKPEWDNKTRDKDIKGYRDWRDEEYMEYVFQTFGFWAPIVTRVGDTLIIDHEEYSNLGRVLLSRYPEFKQTTVAIGGHNDGTFCTPKPGHIITADWHTDYSESFPGWKVHVVEDPEKIEKEEFDKYRRWKRDKEDSDLSMRWWQEGAHASPEYIKFVEDWMNSWVGFVEESVFEVNMLSVSEDTILCLNDNKSVQDHLRSIGLTPIYCRFRNRQFWDGGLHCLTLDTIREGSKQNYFNTKYS